jgi:hypothetical protein
MAANIRGSIGLRGVKPQLLAHGGITEVLQAQRGEGAIWSWGAGASSWSPWEPPAPPTAPEPQQWPAQTSHHE